MAILSPVSTAMRAKSPYKSPYRTVDTAETSPVQLAVPASRLTKLRHGINLSHWFAQASDYSQKRLETDTTAEDIALIKTMGFDHVRFTIEPAPLFKGPTNRFATLRLCGKIQWFPYGIGSFRESSRKGAKAQRADL